MASTLFDLPTMIYKPFFVAMNDRLKEENDRIIPVQWMWGQRQREVMTIMVAAFVSWGWGGGITPGVGMQPAEVNSGVGVGGWEWICIQQVECSCLPAVIYCEGTSSVPAFHRPSALLRSQHHQGQLETILYSWIPTSRIFDNSPTGWISTNNWG